MNEPLKLMCIFAHPDDETFGPGGALAKYSDEGIETYLVTATRGERGWPGNPEDYPGLKALGEIREKELREVGQVLGIREISFLDYIDGDLDKVVPAEIVPKIVNHLRRVRPQVVITFDPFGVYGHPDHIAISQFTLAAITAAAAPSLGGEASLPPHTVSKLYFVTETKAALDGFKELGMDISIPVDEVERHSYPWPEWAVSAEVDATGYWEKVVEAMRSHRSQGLENFDFESMPKRFDPKVWGILTYYRAFSLVNSGRAKERDLFEGLRPQPVRVEVGT